MWNRPRECLTDVRFCDCAGGGALKVESLMHVEALGSSAKIPERNEPLVSRRVQVLELAVELSSS
jgi:hypothetical protein